MATIQSLKTLTAAAKTGPGDLVTYPELKAILDTTHDELLNRGVKITASTTALQTLSRTDASNVLVENNGFYKGSASGTPNGSTIFAAAGGGVWVKILGASTSDTVYTALLSFVSAISDNDSQVNATVLATSPMQKFEFAAISEDIIEGLPCSMLLVITGAESILLDFPSDYVGTPFRYTHTNGDVYAGFFINGEINL